MPRPFVRGRFDDLPAEPRVPHAYFRTSAREVELASSAFGTHRVHVREHGDGPPLLLIHGLMTSSYSWRYVLDALGAKYRLLIPDLPGCGRTDPPLGASYTPEALATWIRELVAALGVRGCRAVGNSMGGYLCMRASLDDPGLFSRLVNIHSPGLPELRHWALGAALAVPGTLALLSWWVRRAPDRWAHQNVHYYDETLKSLEEAREYGAPLTAKPGADAFVRYLDETLSPKAMQRFERTLLHLRDAGKPFPIPILLLYSRIDPLVPPNIGSRLAALVPDAELRWLEETSHFAHVDSPERVTPLLLEFLSGAAK